MAVDTMDLRRQIRQKLDQDKRTRGQPIEIMLTGPVLTLAGNVEKVEQKQAAEELARSVAGVASIVNDIRVER